MAFVLNKYDRSNQVVDTDLSVPIAFGGARIIYPFEGDTENLFLEQDYTIGMDYFPEVVPNPGDRHPDYPELYFLKVSPPFDIGGAVGQYTLTYGILPGFAGGVGGNQRYSRVEGESYVWTKPGITNANSILYFYNVTSISVANGYLTLNTTAGTVEPTFADYGVVQINYLTVDPVSNLSQQRSVVKKIISSDSNSVTVENILDIGVNVYQTFHTPTTAAEPIQRVVPSLIYYTYFLEGVNVDSVEEIPIEEPFKILDSLGNETSYLSVTSNPPLFDIGTVGQSSYKKGWYTMVANKERIIVDVSLRRFFGDIWEKAVRYVTAQ